MTKYLPGCWTPRCSARSVSAVICKYGRECPAPHVSGGEKVRCSISVEGTERKALDERDVRWKTLRVINFPLVIYFSAFASSALSGRKLIILEKCSRHPCAQWQSIKRASRLHWARQSPGPHSSLLALPLFTVLSPTSQSTLMAPVEILLEKQKKKGYVFI